jgi:hypothetical protein
LNRSFLHIEDQAMASVGNYLYGFTDPAFQPGADLRGLAGMPVRVISLGEVGAAVSRHPVQRLMPLRTNVEPHHRVVRHISSKATLVPAAFGHISDSEAQILDVIRVNYDSIREELHRLDRTCEMGLKLSWSVNNVFEHLVRHDRALRELRDRVFRHREPTMNEKLQVGGAFEATLTRERERLTRMVLGAFDTVARDSVSVPPRSEKVICQASLLVDQSRAAEFQQALERAAALFDANFALEYSGPWPPYSFVRLRLQPPRNAGEA